MVLNTEDYASYTSKFNKGVKRLLNQKERAYKSLLFLSELHLQKGIVDYQHDNTLKAVRNFSTAYSYWKECNSKSYDLPEYDKLAGIFNLLIGNLPQPYSQWVSWFGFNGDTQTGFEYLENYLRRQHPNTGDQYEALLYLSFSYLKFGQDEKVIKSFVEKYASTKIPDFLQSILLRCANKIRDPFLCASFFEKRSDFPPLVYLKGKYAVQKGYDGAPKILNRYLNMIHNEEFRADAYRYLSWHYLLNGQPIKYENYRDSIRVLTEFPTSEDRQARYEAKLDGKQDTLLLKARMLFDIGAYKEAQKALIGYSQNNGSVKKYPEFHYRLGRSFYAMGDTLNALNCFSETIALPDKDKRYFRPYAALYAAEIYLSRNDTLKGAEMIQKAKALNEGEYQYTIGQKIKKLDRF